MEEIESLTISETSTEFLVHLFDERDERFQALYNRREIVQMILYLKTSSQSQVQSDEKIPIYFVEEINLDLYLTTEEDIEDGHTIRPEDEDMIMMNY